MQREAPEVVEGNPATATVGALQCSVGRRKSRCRRQGIVRRVEGDGGAKRKRESVREPARLGIQDQAGDVYRHVADRRGDGHTKDDARRDGGHRRASHGISNIQSDNDIGGIGTSRKLRRGEYQLRQRVPCRPTGHVVSKNNKCNSVETGRGGRQRSEQITRNRLAAKRAVKKHGPHRGGARRLAAALRRGLRRALSHGWRSRSGRGWC